jgi:hypothetical protein
MHAMQYEFTLPADYDMGIIRDRVATKGSALDDFAGLGLKAYGIRERGVGGSPVNAYAPFYLWDSVAGMNSFLWGEGFRGLCASFGRPAVRHWPGAAFERGPAWDTAPRASSRRVEAIPADADPAERVEQALGELRERAGLAGVHSTALAVDPLTWELVHFTLWETAAPESAGVRYQVLHLSHPHAADLAVGRHW